MDIRNKTARSIAVRIPLWADKNSVRINGSSRSFRWLGNYALIQHLKGKDEISIEFPMKESTREYYLTGFRGDAEWYKRKDELPRYVLHFKGNTCIDAEFPDLDKFFRARKSHVGYPVYQRDRYRGNKAPMKRVSRYVSPRLASW